MILKGLIALPAGSRRVWCIVTTMSHPYPHSWYNFLKQEDSTSDSLARITRGSTATTGQLELGFVEMCYPGYPGTRVPGCPGYPS
eukprot:2133767-Rhodomonas_salina.2